jgi:tetratricopeptide (TPR) repeat protein
MAIDPENPVVRVLATAAAREAAEPDAAAAAYRQAWELATDDYERCMAAHYLARVQATEDDRYRWNALALERALVVADERVAGFLASLRLNLGRSLEDLGRVDEARAEYGAARDAARELPEGAYRSTIEDALDRAGRRVGQ